MRHTALRTQLRDARRARGLSQAALAELSGTSRVTIARLEGGSARDVRTRTLERLCDALGLELTAIPAASRPGLETLLEREREQTRRLSRRLAHAGLAARLLAMRSPASAALIRQARSVVDRWERDRLCSAHYVSRWRSMLEGPSGRVAASLLAPGEWGDALFQNTPWSFAFERPAR